MALTKEVLLNTQDLIRGWLTALPKQIQAPRGAKAKRQVVQQLDFILSILAEQVDGLGAVSGSAENKALARKLVYFLQLEISQLGRVRGLLLKDALTQSELEEILSKAALIKPMILGDVKPVIRALQLAA